MAQQNQFLGGAQNYGMGHMNARQLQQQQQMASLQGGGKPTLNAPTSFNPPQGQTQQGSNQYIGARQPSQLQYQQQLQRQRLMTQRMMAQNQQKPPYQQQPPQPQGQTAPTQPQQIKAMNMNINNININAMTPSQRRQYFMHQRMTAHQQHQNNMNKQQQLNINKQQQQQQQININKQQQPQSQQLNKPQFNRYNVNAPNQAITANPNQGINVNANAMNMNQTQYAEPQQPQYPMLPNRKFIDVSNAQWNDPLRQIRVVTFNVMPKNADFKNKLQRSDGLQGYRTRPNYYSWSKRGPLLIEEIKRYSPDIICLQGCDQFDYFQQKLAPRGFVGVYERTTQPLLMKSVYFGDGLAIFWRTEKFELSGRQKCLLGDNRYISNIALLARLKRRSPFINPNHMISMKQNIVFETNIICKDKQFWCVLSRKYLYLFKEKQVYDQNGMECFDLDLFEHVVKKKENSFELIPKHKNDKTLQRITFIANDINMNLLWIKHIKSAQIGIEIDVWNAHLIDGHNVKFEYRRVKQSQVLFECMSRASLQTNLTNKNIGANTDYNPYSANSDSSNPLKFYQNVLDSKLKKKDIEEKKETNNLSELFKKMMETRINTQKQIKPVIINPNKVKTEKNEEDEMEKEEVPTGGILNNDQKEKEKEKELLQFQVPTQLHRPVILCLDISSNAWGDALFRIPPLCYTYLTMKSRTTQNNALYTHSQEQLKKDPNCQTERHSWFLQSAYALGFQQEPELTSFNRYWPYDISQADAFSSNLSAQTKQPDFSESIEISKCSDLVLFSPQHFRVLKLLEPISKQWVYSKWNRTLPNIDYPSDHTMIGVQFELAIPAQSTHSKQTQIAPPTQTTATPVITQPVLNTTNIVKTPTTKNNSTTPVSLKGSIATSALPTAQSFHAATGSNNPYYSPFAQQQKQQQQRFGNRQ